MKRQSLCLYTLTILLSVFLLSACGFALRGSQSGDFRLPFKTLSMSIPTTDFFGATLKRHIESTGTRVVQKTAAAKPVNKSGKTTEINESTEVAQANENTDATEVKKPPVAEVQLDILENKRSRETLSLSTAGRVREYALFYTFRFQVRDAQGTVLMPPVEIRLRRTQTYDDSQAYAKEKEAEMLYEDMENDIILQLLRRLAKVQVDPGQSGDREPEL